ncbi:uncharacterized protein LOC105431144 [Pogonomyrmex barbatus]|uniref:Uncharacterized protein LOC105431144 n=1 Tax=Pogonomyrmex barbatus TaxID=144034 RepID=A0A6I9WKP7_9HYME|nr:uncharacterized protein LOC105431144 [Pogonomyrmex barbatus]
MDIQALDSSELHNGDGRTAAATLSRETAELYNTVKLHSYLAPRTSSPPLRSDENCNTIWRVTTIMMIMTTFLNSKFIKYRTLNRNISAHTTRKEKLKTLII